MRTPISIPKRTDAHEAREFFLLMMIIMDAHLPWRAEQSQRLPNTHTHTHNHIDMDPIPLHRRRWSWILNRATHSRDKRTHSPPLHMYKNVQDSRLTLTHLSPTICFSWRCSHTFIYLFCVPIFSSPFFPLLLPSRFVFVSFGITFLRTKKPH